MKLFNENTVHPVSFSLEQYSTMVNHASVISEEAMTDYFYKLKDVFATAFKTLSLNGSDKILTDIESTKFETLHKVRNIKFTDAKAYTVSKPENFKGKYIDYSTDLISISKVIVEDTEACLSNLKMAIASFINEYSDKKVFTLYGAVYFTKTDKLVEEKKKEVAKYFPTANGQTKACVSELLKTFNDIEGIYKNIDTLGNTVNYSTINHIAKLTAETSELIDTLIVQNTKSNVLVKNNDVKKDLVNAIHTAAREVELLNYMYANAVMFYGCFKNLADELNKIPT